MTCFSVDNMVDERLNYVLTQYRESPKILFLLSTYLKSIVQLYSEVCDLPSMFDIETAVGDQLTLIGKRLGWPRTHCVCEATPVFGFTCEGVTPLRPIVGFCEGGSWERCAAGISEIHLEDDDFYRKFLQVRCYQFNRMFDIESLQSALRIFFGSTATVLHAGNGRVVIAPGRDLNAYEIACLQLYPRVLPVALGINVRFHFGTTRVFGFGEGWGGLNEVDPTLTTLGQGYVRTGKIFGFCGDGSEFGGFCESWEPDGIPLVTGEIDADGNPVYIVDENGDPIYSGPLTADANWQCRSSAPWMCEIDVQPYSC